MPTWTVVTPIALGTGFSLDQASTDFRLWRSEANSYLNALCLRQLQIFHEKGFAGKTNLQSSGTYLIPPVRLYDVAASLCGEGESPAPTHLCLGSWPSDEGPLLDWSIGWEVNVDKKRHKDLTLAETLLRMCALGRQNQILVFWTNRRGRRRGILAPLKNLGTLIENIEVAPGILGIGDPSFATESPSREAILGGLEKGDPLPAGLANTGLERFECELRIRIKGVAAKEIVKCCEAVTTTVESLGLTPGITLLIPRDFADEGLPTDLVGFSLAHSREISSLPALADVRRSLDEFDVSMVQSGRHDWDLNFTPTYIR